MASMATHALAKAVLAGVAAFAGASSMAEAPARPVAPAAVIAQIGAEPEFRARRALRLEPTADGPTAEAPLSFGRRQPAAPGTPTTAPAARSAAAAKSARAEASPVASAVKAAAPGADGTTQAPAGARQAAPATTEPASATRQSALSPKQPAPAADRPGPVPATAQPSAVATSSPARKPATGAGRDEEARALARLRARIEETLASHSAVDATVKVDRGAVRVVSHGSSEPRRATVASAANGAGGRAPGTPRRRAEAAANPLVGTTAFRDWSYRGETGPAHWARLNPEWAACAADIPQAPIDIREGIAVGLPPIEFDLPPAKLTILDDGRAIRAVVREGPGIVTLGRRFELREITFHQPAEFRIEGRTFDLSAHLLHRDEDGRAAVVVVLFEVGDASTPRNPVVQTVLDYLPLAQDMLMPVPERRDLRELLPADPGYYNFVGALSSPPCTAGVVWMVMREPLRIPPSQVAIFARVHPMNVRPLQPLAGRLIKQSE